MVIKIDNPITGYEVVKAAGDPPKTAELALENEVIAGAEGSASNVIQNVPVGVPIRLTFKSTCVNKPARSTWMLCAAFWRSLSIRNLATMGSVLNLRTVPR